MRQWENTPENERARQRPSRPPYSDWRDERTSNTNRLMCVVGFPSLDRTLGFVDWGVGCLGCNNAWRCCSTEGYNGDWKERFRGEKTLYSKSGFVFHFMTCLPAQELFQREVDNILGPGKLLPWSRFFCHVAGDPPSKELSPSPCAASTEAASSSRNIEVSPETQKEAKSSGIR